jgi:cell division protease FtsH
LLEWETIDGDQIDDIMAGRPPRAPKDWSGSSSSGGSGTAPAVGGETATTTA